MSPYRIPPIARAGIKLWAFLNSAVPSDKMHEVALYGTQVVKVTGTYDRAKELATEFARQRNLYYDKGARSIAAVESMKTLAFEIAEQLGRVLGPRTFAHTQRQHANNSVARTRLVCSTGKRRLGSDRCRQRVLGIETDGVD